MSPSALSPVLFFSLKTAPAYNLLCSCNYPPQVSAKQTQAHDCVEGAHRHNKAAARQRHPTMTPQAWPPATVPHKAPWERLGMAAYRTAQLRCGMTRMCATHSLLAVVKSASDRKPAAVCRRDAGGRVSVEHNRYTTRWLLQPAPRNFDGQKPRPKLGALDAPDLQTLLYCGSQLLGVGADAH